MNVKSADLAFLSLSEFIFELEVESWF